MAIKGKITSVRDIQKPKRSTQILNEYNEKIRYQYRPTGWVTKNLPLLIAPLFTTTVVFLGIAIFITIFVLSNPQFMMNSGVQLTGDQKGEIVAAVSMALFAPNFILGYLLNFIIVHNVARSQNFRTSKSNFVSINFVVFLVLSIAIYFGMLIYGTTNVQSKVALWFSPIWIFSLGLINTYGYRAFNELYRRKPNGEIVLHDTYQAKLDMKKKCKG